MPREMILKIFWSWLNYSQTKFGSMPMSLINQRVVYLNGVYVPENEAVVPIKDQGFKYGDGVFDTTRTFGHKIFKLKEHLERFTTKMKLKKKSSN